MRQDYTVLFNVLWQHDFYAGSMPSLFTVKPDEETLHLMKRYQVVYKTYANSLSVLFDQSLIQADDARETFLQQPLLFTFFLYCNDPYLLNYTDGLQNFQVGRQVLHFYNNNDLLHKATSVSDADIAAAELLLPDLFGAAPMAVVEISLKPGMPLDLQIRFKSLATIWRYVVVTTHLKQLNAPAVINKESKELFIGPEPLVLPDNKQALCFRSRAPIQLAYRCSQSFQLVDNYDEVTKKYKVVLQSLPVPDVTKLSVISRERYSEIII
ncbi:hypothetical protein QTN47_04995 [Danxiaibacter flavus]|uniref:DUF3822 family protein n=1 Tax=Danxiaibacter flavus TaxID=3049108 RepID=A0ABV3ZAE5_9BACT|nr:hypothetical protein QNM32_04995 [Chitinophagaceae bacterium DXS]